MAEYRSSVLLCNVCEEGCAVCEFLNGSKKESDLLEVIRILDETLAASEEYAKNLLTTFISSIDAKPDGE